MVVQEITASFCYAPLPGTFVVTGGKVGPKLCWPFGRCGGWYGILIYTTLYFVLKLLSVNCSC